MREEIQYMQERSEKMANQRIKTIEKNIDKDVELCRTTNVRVCEHTMKVLVNAQIPFTQKWIKVPFFKRECYNGAKEVCVIKTNRNQYVKARRMIDGMEVFDRERLMLHAV